MRIKILDFKYSKGMCIIKNIFENLLPDSKYDSNTGKVFQTFPFFQGHYNVTLYCLVILRVVKAKYMFKFLTQAEFYLSDGLVEDHITIYA